MNVQQAIFDGSFRIDPDAPELDVWAIHSTVLEAGERDLAAVEAGDTRVDPAWAYHIMQVQIPALRRLAEIVNGPIPEAFAEREREVRARFGVPAPVGA